MDTTRNSSLSPSGADFLAANAPRKAAPAVILEKLEPDERLLWWDQPPAWAFSIGPLLNFLVNAFALAVGWAVFQHIPPQFRTGPWAVALGGFALFVGILILLSIRESAKKLLNSGRVVYALTDRRLIVATGRWRVRSFAAKALRRIKRLGSARGTIWFDFGHRDEGWRYRHALICVKDAPRVEQLIRAQFQTQQSLKQGARG